MRNLKQIRPEDVNVELIMVAAREGRLYLEEDEKTVSDEVVKESVRTYVERIRGCVTSKYQETIDVIWEEILRTNDFLVLLKPSTKARDGRDVNTYNVMRIIGVLHEAGVYESYSQRVYDNLLEPTIKDSPYRKYLGKGFDKHSLLIKLLKIINDVKL